MIATLRGEGGQGPPLVYVPGIDGGGDLLLGTAARLEQRFRLLRLAYRPDGDDTYEALARAVVALLESLGVERAPFLAESFGGALGLQLALDHPGCVRGLAIVNGFAHFRRRARLALSALVLPFVPSPFFQIGRRTLGPRALIGPRRDPRVERLFLACPGIECDEGYARRLRMVRAVDLRPRLAQIRRPVALFASERDRVVDSLFQAREMAARIPGATLEVLAGSGHVVLPFPDEPWVERMEALAERAGE